MTKTERETTSLTPEESEELARLATEAGVTRSAMLRLLMLDGMRRYCPAQLDPLVEAEARTARIRLTAIRDDRELAAVPAGLPAYG